MWLAQESGADMATPWSGVENAEDEGVRVAAMPEAGAGREDGEDNEVGIEVFFRR